MIRGWNSFDASMSLDPLCCWCGAWHWRHVYWKVRVEQWYHLLITESPIITIGGSLVLVEFLYPWRKCSIFLSQIMWQYIRDHIVLWLKLIHGMLILARCDICLQWLVHKSLIFKLHVCVETFSYHLAFECWLDLLSVFIDALAIHEENIPSCSWIEYSADGARVVATYMLGWGSDTVLQE